MRLISWLILFSLVVLLSGCGQPAADLAMSPKRHKDGIAFHHLGHWRVTETTAEPGFIM
jgi:hypothetical protein